MRFAAQQLALADLEDDAAGVIGVTNEGDRVDVAAPRIDGELAPLDLLQPA